MKHVFIIIFVLVTTHLFAQINPVSISPVKIGDMNLQAGKVFYQHTFNGNSNLLRLAERFKSKEQVYSVFNLNTVSADEIKGTITNFQLNIDQYGVKRKKLAPYLIRPLNATFKIEPVDGKNRVTVGSIWFNKLPGDKSFGENLNMEVLSTSKNATVFLKDKKSLKSIAVIEKNLEELFSAATMPGNGF